VQASKDRWRACRKSQESARGGGGAKENPSAQGWKVKESPMCLTAQEVEDIILSEIQAAESGDVGAIGRLDCLLVEYANIAPSSALRQARKLFLSLDRRLPKDIAVAVSKWP